MRTNQWAKKQTLSRFVSSAMSALEVSLDVGATAQAQSMSLIAGNDPALESFFTLDFGGEGGIASGHIAFTNIDFEVDADGGSARFVRYYQEVEPLILPGGFSTGNLTIEIVQDSSAGSYDELSGQFNTEELYRISFEGDLSAFGLESPVFLPSTSSGIVTLDADSGGRIALDWIGEGELANPGDPDNPLEFSYTCTVRAAFDPEPITLVRLALIPDVLNLELPRRTEKKLTKKLFQAVDKLNRGGQRGAAKKLKSFIKKVRKLSTRQIAEVDADMLISSADAIMAMLQGAGHRGGRLHHGQDKDVAGGRR